MTRKTGDSIAPTPYDDAHPRLSKGVTQRVWARARRYGRVDAAAGRGFNAMDLFHAALLYILEADEPPGSTVAERPRLATTIGYRGIGHARKRLTRMVERQEEEIRKAGSPLCCLQPRGYDDTERRLFRELADAIGEYQANLVRELVLPCDAVMAEAAAAGRKHVRPRDVAAVIGCRTTQVTGALREARAYFSGPRMHEEVLG